MQQPRTWIQRAVVVRSVGRRGNIAAACPSAFFRLYFFHNQQKQQLLLRRSRSFDRAHITNSTHNYSATLHPEKWLRRQARFSFSQFQRHQQFASRPLPGRPASGKGSTTLRFHGKLETSTVLPDGDALTRRLFRVPQRQLPETNSESLIGNIARKKKVKSMTC